MHHNFAWRALACAVTVTGLVSCAAGETGLGGGGAATQASGETVTTGDGTGGNTVASSSQSASSSDSGTGGAPSGELELCVLNDSAPDGACQMPEELDFGVIPTGTEVVRLFRIGNDTGEDVEFSSVGTNVANFDIQAVRFEPDPGDPNNLLRVEANVPITRSQGQSLWFEVSYTSLGSMGPLPQASVRVTTKIGPDALPDVVVPIKGEESGCPEGSGACDQDPTNGCETNTATSANHCGSCGHACAYAHAAASCVDSQCEIGACDMFYQNCDGDLANGCESNRLNDVEHCGDCATSCVKANTLSFCNGGNCNIQGCSNNFADCNLLAVDGCETNLANTLAHCGGCNLACDLAHATESCTPNLVTGLGACTLGQCDADWANCDNVTANGCETNTTNDAANCGGCNTPCNFANAAESCVNSGCVLGNCDPGFANCDNNALTGCEVDLGNDPLHCGNCATNCSNVYPGSSVACGASACQFLGCLPNRYNLDGNLANGCEYACVFQSATDLPDDAFVDANCDGIDGDANAAIFVATNGNDLNAGTRAAPMASLPAAIGRASANAKTQIYVSEGIYAGRVTLVAGISIYGAYSSANNWARSNSYVSTVRSNSVAGSRVTAMEGFNIANATTVDHMTIETQSTNVAGTSNYAFYCSGCSALVIRSSVLIAGGAGPGASGGNGSAGAAATPGTGGSNGSCDGGSWGAGGPAGGGCRSGGAGGRGGTEGSNAGIDGGTGQIGVAFGAAGGGGDPGHTGDDGDDGPPGNPGANGSGAGGGFVSGGFWSGSNGGTGGLGGSGNGGGGGGGGGGQGCFFCNDGSGNGGGGGGGGGCGGTGASGGTAGGGSFGLFLVSSTGVVVTGNTISSGAGGNGGAGGTGGTGGGGAAGGDGATHCTGEIGAGGNGGDGGSGGRGGHGGGGAGGPSYAIYRSATSVVTAGNVLDAGNGGSGGPSPGNGGTPGASSDVF